MPRLLPESNHPPKKWNPVIIRGPWIPHFPPEDLVEFISLIERGQEPVPSLHICGNNSYYDPMLVVIKTSSFEDIEANLRNFIAVKLARISLVDCVLHALTEDENKLNYHAIARGNKRAPEPGYLDDNQIEQGLEPRPTEEAPPPPTFAPQEFLQTATNWRVLTTDQLGITGRMTAPAQPRARQNTLLTTEYIPNALPDDEPPF